MAEPIPHSTLQSIDAPLEASDAAVMPLPPSLLSVSSLARSLIPAVS
jgi:hypothetical protein